MVTDPGMVLSYSSDLDVTITSSTAQASRICVHPATAWPSHTNMDAGD